MPNSKKYILTGVVLGSIAAVSAGLIALTNLITTEKIKQNENNKIFAGISEIFGENSKIKSEKALTKYEYTVHYYEVTNRKDKFLGYAFKCEGSNMYGKIALLAGFDGASHNFMTISLITNEQTYASTLEDNYIVPLNSVDASDEKAKTDALNDVSCGATYGAKLVRSMINDAEKAAKDLWK